VRNSTGKIIFHDIYGLGVSEETLALRWPQIKGYLPIPFSCMCSRVTASITGHWRANP
jgi:hypothetical protein